MSDLLTRIAAHGEDALADRVRVEVPEWSCALWFPRTLTVARQQRIRKGVPDGDQAALMVSFILHQAETEDGAKAFEVNAKSRATLEGKADMRVLARIVAEAGANDVAEDVPAAKNG